MDSSSFFRYLASFDRFGCLLTFHEGVALQLHYSARILLLLHRPSLGGLGGFIEQQATLAKSVDIICGIAVTLTDDASSVMSSQSLFIGTCLKSSRR
jgi:hypothetical protein